MGSEMDRLEVQVEAQASNANRQLDALIGKLKKLSGALTGVNLGGFTNMAAGVRNLSSAMKTMSGVKATDFTRISNGIKNICSIDTEKLYKASNAMRNFSSSMSGMSGLSIPNIDAKNVNSAVKTMEKLSGIDTAKASQTSDSVKKIADSMAIFNSVNASENGVINLTNAMNRLIKTDLSAFNAGEFAKITQAISGLGGMPDVSRNLNSFVSSLAKLASAGGSADTTAQTLPLLTRNLKKSIKVMSGARDISESTNMFVQSIGRLASAGNKTAQTASGLQNLADETLKFFDSMKKAPTIRENTVRMTEALAKLASAGGKVGTAGNTVQTAFDKISKAGSGTVNIIKKSVSHISSAFRKIGNSSIHINKASMSLRNLLKSALPILGIRQLFNWGKQAVEISSDLTEVQNVVDTTFGDFKDKIEDFSNTSIQDYGMSELTAKQISSRFQAMGVAMGFTQGRMSEMSVELTRLAADMASFYNVEQSDVAESLESIFTGQTRPLRQYGLDLTQATVEEWALKQGIDADMQSMSQASKTLLRYQYVMANTAAAQGDFARTSNTWANQTRILGQSFRVLGSTIGGVIINAFKPLVSWLNTVMLKVISVVETIANTLGAIFGWTIETTPGGATSDYDDMADSIGSVGDAADGAGSSLGNAADKAKELKNAIMGFDEINKLPDDMDSSGSSGSGNGGGSGSGTGSDAGTAQIVQTESIIEKYKSEIESLEKLGEYIGTSLTKAMQKIDWGKVYSAAESFGTGLASFLNGLISPELFGETGRLVANSLNTALYTLNSFGETFNWTNFGTSISTGLNKFFRNFKVSLAADTFDTWVNGIVDAAGAAVDTAEWDTYGDRIASCVQKALNGIEWDDAQMAASGFGFGLATALNKLMTTETFESVGKTVAGSINTVISGAYSFLNDADFKQFANSVANGINTFIADIGWEDVGRTIGTGLQNAIDFCKTLISELKWSDIKSALGGLWKGIAESVDMGEVGKILVTALGSWLALNTITAIGSSVMSSIGSTIISGISSAVVAAVGAIGLGPIAVAIGAALAAIFVVPKVVEWLKDVDWNAVGQKVSDLFAAGIGKIDAVVKAGVELAKKGWDTVTGWLSGLGAAAQGAISATVSLAKKVGGWASDAWSVLTTDASKTVTRAVGLVKKAGSWISDAWTALTSRDKTSVVSTALHKASTWISDAWSALMSDDKTSIVSTALKKSFIWVADAWTALTSGDKTSIVSTALKKGQTWISEAWTALTTSSNSIQSYVSLAKKAGSWVSDAWTALISKSKTTTISAALIKAKNWKSDAFKVLTSGSTRTISSFVTLALKFGSGVWSVASWVKKYIKDKIGDIKANIVLTMANIKLPHFYLKTGKKSIPILGDIEYPTGIGVNWYAKGGVFTSATIAGIGEAGKEAVLPLENEHTMKMIADSITSNMSEEPAVSEDRLKSIIFSAVSAAISQFQNQGDSGATQAINVYVGGKKVTDVVIEEVNNRTKSTGVCPIMT